MVHKTFKKKGILLTMKTKALLFSKRR